MKRCSELSGDGRIKSISAWTWHKLLLNRTKSPFSGGGYSQFYVFVIKAVCPICSFVLASLQNELERSSNTSRLFEEQIVFNGIQAKVVESDCSILVFF